MRNSFAIQSVLLSSFFATLAFAETPVEQMDRFGIAYRLGLNVTADFKKLGGLTPMVGGPGPGPATGGGIDRTYDDGYNKRDIRGNALGLTWNWGYNNASQVPGNDTILMHSASSTASTSSKNIDGDPQHGFEFSYNRRIKEVGKGWWGMEAALGYAGMTFNDHRALRGDVSLLTDAYALGGVVAPLAPYRGDFTGPGPLISDSPMRTIQTIPGGATIVGKRSLDADVDTFRIGPYLEFPASKHLSFEVSGGFAAAYIESDFRFTETVIMGTDAVTRRGVGTDNDWLIGGYAAAQVSWKLSEKVDIFGGAQYMALEKYSQSLSGKTVELDMRNSIFVTVGLGFSFR